MSEEFGSGIYLDQKLDFGIGTTGDLRTVSGRDELEKDLSLQMIFSLQEYLGRPPTGSLNVEVKNTAMRVARADVRVSSVDEEEVSVEWSDDREQLSVDIPVTISTGEEYDLVFEV